jgi:hypothetical protein
VEAAEKDAQAMLAELKNGKPFEAAAREYNVDVKQSGFFQRDQTVPGVPDSTAVARAAFSLSDQNKLPDEPLRESADFWVFRFKEKKPPGPEEYEKEKESVQEKLLQQKRFKLFDAWMKQRREKSVVSVEEGFLKKA